MIINASSPPAIVTNFKCHKSIKPTAVYFMRFYEPREISFAVGCFSGHDQVLVNLNGKGLRFHLRVFFLIFNFF